MDLYGLEQSEVNTIMKKGMKWKEENTEKWHARMASFECVFVKQEESYFVITVYASGDEQ